MYAARTTGNGATDKGEARVEEMVFGRRYRVTEKIGSGGMADVYKAVDEVLGRTVAVKVMYSRYAADPDFVARFRQEAQAAANLSHPSIVNIYDWGQDNSTYYIVMEYVRGTDLKSLIQQRGPVTAEKAAEYGAQVAAALSVAHGYDIIHRDIKPHNIVLTPDGTVKVMDFGIARAVNTNMTQTGSVLGTAHYVSPEQAQGRTLGPASDLYSLGVVLYELTTGRVPFEGDTPVAVALKQVNEDPVPPRQVNPDIPPAMETVIMRAMQKDPAARYSSAEEIRRDLTRVASGRMVEAVTPDDTTVMPAVEREERLRSARVRPVPQRPRVWPWVVAILALLAVALVAAWQLGLFEPPTPMVVVPDVTGLSLADATEALAAVELTVGQVEERFAEEDSGTVIAQAPEQGREVDPGSSVDLVVSKGEELFTVPDLAGMPESDAIRALRDAGFELDTIDREYNSQIAEGLVISTSPAAGGMFPSGTPVTLIVSRGTELKRVPSVVGRTQAEADSTLKGEGFAVKVTEEFSDTVAQGTVIRQSPEAGVSLEVGAEVTIVVSKGEESIEVPNVIDQTEEEAVTTLEEAGFDVRINYQVSPDDGVVLTQDPVPGASGKRGDTVTIWVGRSPSD